MVVRVVITEALPAASAQCERPTFRAATFSARCSFFFLEGRDWSRTVSVSLIKYCRGWSNESQQSLFFRSPFSAALNLYKSMSTRKDAVFISTDYIRDKQQGTSRVPDLPLCSKSNSPLFLISKTNEDKKLA